MQEITDFGRMVAPTQTQMYGLVEEGALELGYGNQVYLIFMVEAEAELEAGLGEQEEQEDQDCYI